MSPLVKASPGSTVSLDGYTHVVGECCAYWKCRWCDSVVHTQAVTKNRGDEVSSKILEACESCDHTQFHSPVNGKSVVIETEDSEEPTDPTGKVPLE